MLFSVPARVSATMQRVFEALVIVRSNSIGEGGLNKSLFHPPFFAKSLQYSGETL